MWIEQFVTLDLFAFVAAALLEIAGCFIADLEQAFRV